mmetsp:Transcript_42681/g.100145  ORF Transcript_42681/g.100145 Transcript_42681/m.100145 type:complete len:218 (-) Transcript_42681:1017-1670(-)
MSPCRVLERRQQRAEQLEASTVGIIGTLARERCNGDRQAKRLRRVVRCHFAQPLREYRGVQRVGPALRRAQHAAEGARAQFTVERARLHERALGEEPLLLAEDRRKAIRELVEQLDEDVDGALPAAIREEHVEVVHQPSKEIRDCGRHMLAPAGVGGCVARRCKAAVERVALQQDPGDTGGDASHGCGVALHAAEQRVANRAGGRPSWRRLGDSARR